MNDEQKKAPGMSMSIITHMGRFWRGGFGAGWSE